MNTSISITGSIQKQLTDKGWAVLNVQVLPQHPAAYRVEAIDGTGHTQVFLGHTTGDILGQADKFESTFRGVAVTA